MRKNARFAGATAVAEAPKVEKIVDSGEVERIAESAMSPKPKKKRLPPQGEYGRIHASREEAEKFPVSSSEQAENDPWGIWQFDGKVVWAKNKQEAVYLCSVPQRRVDKLADDKVTVIGYSYDAVDPDKDAVRLDAERKGRQRKLTSTDVSFLLRLLEENDAAKFEKVGPLMPHFVPYFPVEFGGIGKEIPPELANDPLVLMMV